MPDKCLVYKPIKSCRDFLEKRAQEWRKCKNLCLGKGGWNFPRYLRSDTGDMNGCKAQNLTFGFVVSFPSTPSLNDGHPHNSVKRRVCYLRHRGPLSTDIRRDGAHTEQASPEPVWFSKLSEALTRGTNNGVNSVGVPGPSTIWGVDTRLSPAVMPSDSSDHTAAGDEERHWFFSVTWWWTATKFRATLRN